MQSIMGLVFAAFFIVHVRGTNIMLNKPSIQSGISTNYPASNANDGNRTRPPSRARQQNQADPYWRGDLQGFYSVTSVSVTSTEYRSFDYYLQKAIIGVSVQDVGCTVGSHEVTRCGKWPNTRLSGQTIVFDCSNAGPVRFVRVWREGKVNLALGEVEVEGTPSRLTGAKYDTILQQKVTTPTMSLSVTSVTGCSRMCLRTQPCLAFSYSPSEQPNCLLATDFSMTSDAKWLSYKIDMCVQLPSCDISGFL